MSPRRSKGLLRPLLWGVLALWAVGLGVLYVTRTVQAAPEAGDVVLTPELRGRTVDGGEIVLLARDSVVALLAATSECAACRTGVPAYREIAEKLRAQGVAFRVVVGSDSAAARQYSRLLPDPGVVAWDRDQAIFRKIRVKAVPTLYLVRRDGTLLRRWAPLPADPRIAEIVASAARTGR